MFGDQTLYNLKTNLYCVCDYMLNQEDYYNHKKVNSFFFIEGCFYYELSEQDHIQRSEPQVLEIDSFINAHNNEISKNLIHTPFLLPDSSLSLSQRNRNTPKPDRSENSSLDSEDLEPRYKVNVLQSHSNKIEESKSDNNKGEDIIDSESHDSYDSSNPPSPNKKTSENDISTDQNMPTKDHISKPPRTHSSSKHHTYKLSNQDKSTFQKWYSNTKFNDMSDYSGILHYYSNK
jgi:hypothetical protein